MTGPQIELSEDSLDAERHVINVRGEIHLSTAPQLSSRVNDAIDIGKTAIVLDLMAVEFIDSTGLSVLLNALRRLNNKGGSLAVACANPTVLRLFEITRLDSTISLFATRDEALAYIS